MNYDRLGALIATTSSAVMAGGPADKAGLRPGDVIVKFENREINTPEELIVAVRAQSVGDRVKLIYLRKGKELSATLTLIAAKN